MAVDVTRISVNQCATTSVGGHYLNGFYPSTTLGCGFWGGNAISENLTYKHLMNITRIGYKPAKARIPTAEEVWAEE